MKYRWNKKFLKSTSAEENWRVIMYAGHQQQFRINVWAGFVVWLCDWQCLQEFPTSFSWLLENMCFWYDERGIKDDGTEENFSRSVSSVLSGTYYDKRTGRAGPVAWPPRSSDLSRLGFYQWGQLKPLMYSDPNDKENTFYRPNFDFRQTIRKGPGPFKEWVSLWSDASMRALFQVECIFVEFAMNCDWTNSGKWTIIQLGICIVNLFCHL
jgi:hypothetical protein